MPRRWVFRPISSLNVSPRPDEVGELRQRSRGVQAFGHHRTPAFVPFRNLVARPHLLFAHHAPPRGSPSPFRRAGIRKTSGRVLSGSSWSGRTRATAAKDRAPTRSDTRGPPSSQSSRSRDRADRQHGTRNNRPCRTRRRQKTLRPSLVTPACPAANFASAAGVLAGESSSHSDPLSARSSLPEARCNGASAGPEHGVARWRSSMVASVCPRIASIAGGRDRGERSAVQRCLREKRRGRSGRASSPRRR